jgi:predicted MFS family arabinose efflux permease
MQAAIRSRIHLTTSTWGRYLIVLALSVFLERLGQGLIGGASTNFFVDVLGLDGRQVLWLAGIREIPGLTLMFIAALIMHLPLSRRAAVSLLLMGVGFGLYALVHSYVALLAVAVLASLGFHNWMPLQSSLALALTKRAHSGRMLGRLSSMGALASIVGMGLTAALATTLPLRAFYVVGGIAIVIGALLVSRIPKEVGEGGLAQPRLLLKSRYWLYYVLTFFEGSRMQVFGTFGTLILVQNYGLSARQISLLLAVSGILNFVLAPRLGHLLDGVGERITLSTSYVALALCFVGYATVHNVWFLCAMLISINLLVTLSIGLSTYVNRIAPPEELTPTLSAGVSINHITSVSMSLVAGTLLSLVGYEWLCYGAAAIIMVSVPFALAIKVEVPPMVNPQPAAAE